MPRTSTASWWSFSPETREVQLDEKWSFLGKKEKLCGPLDPHDAHQGHNWDQVAWDPEHRLVVSVVPGKRTAANTERLVNDFKERTGGRPLNLITSHEYAPYKTAILEAYGEEVTPPRSGKPGRPQGPYHLPPPGSNYVAVHETPCTRHRARDTGKRPGGESRLPGGLRPR
jgi:hypothetical protein